MWGLFSEQCLAAGMKKVKMKIEASGPQFLAFFLPVWPGGLPARLARALLVNGGAAKGCIEPCSSKL